NDVQPLSSASEGDDPFWSPEVELTEPLAAEAEPLDHSADDSFDLLSETIVQPTATPEAPVEPPPPPGKNDYLANARKAAQAQSLPKAKNTETGATPQLSLRGQSRIVLWGAASLITALVV